ncbi:SDR family oxidoreductase [Limnoglobus roseus]|uniref:dTDP-4-dehydrorhamnose reductase n=1 Tax=Limnoglobus roseus TaxID=2598579 RepID=A0A5C1ASA9_9BACT|nr:sugar nucleotide-binding protein [Limnoglobus roseus]QEL19778.1 dTDP-4-dehydrorhamnose reductase [Limnoglobus roseus]
MRSLILGATGQIGGLLVAECEQRDDAVQGTWYRRPHADFLPLDLCDEESVQRLITDFQPDVVYLAAGLNQIDFAEANPHECRAVNVDGVANVVRAMAGGGAKLVYFSSSQVFGECKAAQKEEATPSPLNAYGTALAEAEQIIRENLADRHLIVRTNCVYGPEERGRNRALHAVRRMRDGQVVTTTDERTCQPTFGPDLATVAVDLVKHGCTGTYHVVGPDRMTEFAFVRMTAFIFGLDSDLVANAPVTELGEEAPRPRSPWLDRQKLRAELGPKALRSPGEGLRALRKAEHVPALARVA